MEVCPICFCELDQGLTFCEYFFSDDVICGKCRHQMIENKYVYHYENLEIHAFYIYDEFMENLLFQFKESRDIALKDIFLWKKKEKINDIFRHHKMVIMPSNEDKTEKRGFHALREMLSCCQVEIVDCLYKDQNYKQSRQKAKSRCKIQEVMKLKKQIEESFYLFDDVLTTGNTLKTAADLLGKGEKVIAYVLAIHPCFVEMCEKV